MEFIQSLAVCLAVYLFLGCTVAYNIKNVGGQHVYAQEGKGYIFLFCVLTWPVMLSIVTGIWFTGGYKKTTNGT